MIVTVLPDVVAGRDDVDARVLQLLGAPGSIPLPPAAFSPLATTKSTLVASAQATQHDRDGAPPRPAHHVAEERESHGALSARCRSTRVSRMTVTLICPG